MVSAKMLTECHARVYKKHGYTFQTGLKAFMRGRRWAKSRPGNKRPPAGIADKLGLWAAINKEIEIEMIRAKEVLKNENAKAGNGDNSTNNSKPDGGPIKVSPDSERKA